MNLPGGLFETAWVFDFTGNLPASLGNVPE